MEIVKLVVQKRHQAGKGVARRLRRAGQLPAVVYGNAPQWRLRWLKKT